MSRTFRMLCASMIFFSSCKSDDEPTDNKNPFLIESGSPALVVAHRGGRGLFPENTMLAFDGAASMSVDVLEMDVCLTKDSVLVTIHDLTINRTSDTSGNVIDFTFDELQAFNFGYSFRDSTGNYPYQNNPVRISRLEDVFAQHPDELMMVEIKDQGANGTLAAQKLDSLLREFDLTGKVVVSSFAYDVLNYFKSINSDALIAGSAGDGYEFVTSVLANPDTTLSVEVDVFAFPTEFLGYNLTSDTVISAAHRHGIAIHYWTINDKDEMKTLIQKGADGIITDRPDLMQKVLDELGF